MHTASRVGDSESGASMIPLSNNPAAESLLDLTLLSGKPHINLLLLDLNPGAIFAGVKTALETARLLSRATALPIRLVLLHAGPLTDTSEARLRGEQSELISTALGNMDFTLVPHSDLSRISFGAHDIWVATHWMTAHALDRAARAGKLSTRNVIYLIQDYEAEFFASGSDRAAAESTYRAGFIPVVNSRQVASFLRERGIDIDDQQVFAPQFDSSQLVCAASQRVIRTEPRVFFYGRPLTPRNMFSLGIEALGLASAELSRRDIPVNFVMAGAPGPDVELAGGHTLRNLGVLERSRYFQEISSVDVGLTLQATPHPSHLPFDIAISGGMAVTNEVDGSRNKMHPRILSVPSSALALSAALVDLIDAARRPGRVLAGYVPVRSGQLGRSLEDVLIVTVRRLVVPKP